VAVPPEPPSSRHPHRSRNRAIVVAVVVGVVMIALFTVPITSSFSDQVSAYVGPAPLPPGPTLMCPPGSHVWGTFSVNGTEPETFVILDLNQDVIYLDNSTNGSFSFTASNPPYTFWLPFYGPEIVFVSGHYTHPIL